MSPAEAPGHSVWVPWWCQTLDPRVHCSEGWETGGPSLGSTLRTGPISDGVDGESPIPGSAAHGGAVPAHPAEVLPSCLAPGTPPATASQGSWLCGQEGGAARPGEDEDKEQDSQRRLWAPDLGDGTGPTGIFCHPLFVPGAGPQFPWVTPAFLTQPELPHSREDSECRERLIP